MRIDRRIGRPNLVMCNIFSEVKRVGEFALDHGFSGIDWSFELATLPKTPAEESMWVNYLSSLKPLEVRYLSLIHI